MTDEWWPEGYDDPAFQVQRQVYGTAIGGDYVRGSEGFYTSHGYLTGTVGSATTPDPGPLPDEFTLVYKVRGPTGGAQNVIAAQWTSSPNMAYMFQRTVGSTNHGFWYSLDGTAVVQRSAPGEAITPTADQFLAMSISRTQFLNRPWSSTNGTGWTPVNAGVTSAPLATPFVDATGVLRIGARITNTEPWNGRIYWVELRTGLDPAAGTVLWRFDADEYPGTGTTWTDPRGRAWTLTTASAITPAVWSPLAQTAVRYSTEVGTLASVGSRSILHVSPISHDTVSVEWGWPLAPNDTWLEMSIVRSAFGRPSTPNDGQTIYRQLRATFINPLYPSADGKAKPLIEPPIVLDQSLPPGRWYHYAVFFKVSPVEWVRGMVDSCLLPRDLQHDEYLWNNVPPYYRWVDGESGQQVGMLRQFLNVFGFELDQAREFVESWQHLYDIDWSPIRLLRQLGPNFGVPYESGIGDIRYRSLMADIGHLYKTRGTVPSLELLVGNMSKYTCRMKAGDSLLLRPDDGDFYTGIGSWAGLHPDTAVSGQTLLAPDKVLLDKTSPGEVTPPAGRGAMKVWTASADATGKILVALGDGVRYPANDANPNTDLEILPKQYGIPAQPGVSYGFSFKVKLTTAPTTVEGCLLFFDEDGTARDMISMQRSAPVGLSDTNWHDFYVKAQAPAGTVFVVPGILFTSRPASATAIPIYIAAAMVYVAGGAGEALVLPPDRYLTMGDPGEVIGAKDPAGHPTFDPFLLGSSVAAVSSAGTGPTGISIFTDFFRQQLFANLALMTGKQIQIVYFSKYAAFTDSQDPRYTAVRTITDLQNVLGWGAPLPATTAHTVSTTDVGNSRYVIDSNPHLNAAGWADTNVVVAAVILKGSYGGVTDPIIFITDSPFGGGTVMRQDDSLVALPAANISNLAWIFGWQTPAAGATQVLPTGGTLSVLKAPPDYEYSHQQHIWMYPQRINFLANPSFELGTGHWRSSGALTRVSGGAPGGGVWEGRVTGSSKLVLESNTFPSKVGAVSSDTWTIQAMIRGTGRVRIGLVSWEADYASTNADWGPTTEVWDLPANGWLHVYAMRRVGEGSTAMVRIECDGTVMNLDNLLCEPEWLPDWPYFDGDTKYGALDDYSWYGGKVRQGATYSLWYNHRRAVVGRLFAWNISDSDFTVTDEEVEAQGYVYKWVPAGVRVIPHMDVLSVGDPQSPIPAVTGTVLPVSTGPSDKQGVPNAWTGVV